MSDRTMNATHNIVTLEKVKIDRMNKIIEMREKLFEIQKQSCKSDNQMSKEIGISAGTYVYFVNGLREVDSKRFMMISKYLEEYESGKQ